jgi:hypothetical protein
MSFRQLQAILQENRDNNSREELLAMESSKAEALAIVGG